MEDAVVVGLNVVRCVVVHSNKRTPLFGVYIPPFEEDMTTTNYLTKVLRLVDMDRAVVLGNLNVCWKEPW